MAAAYRTALASLLLAAVAMHQAPQVKATSVNETARAFAGLRGSIIRSEDAVAVNAQPSTESIADTLKSLDTDGDGKVGRKEIETFARSQGLSTEEVRADFADLDRNHDGELEASEIGSVLTENDASVTEPELRSPKAAPKIAPKATAVLAGKKATRTTQVVDLGATTPRAQAVVPELGRLEVSQNSEEQPKDELNLESLQKNAERQDELNLESLQKNAERQAGSVLAETLAQQAQQMFQQGMQDEQRARSFDKLAKQLRGNITALARSASTETKRAARLASTQAGNGAIAEVRALQKKSEQIEHDANERRKNAKEAMKRVLAAQEHMAAQTRLLSAGIQ